MHIELRVRTLVELVVEFLSGAMIKCHKAHTKVTEDYWLISFNQSVLRQLSLELIVACGMFMHSPL